MLSRTNRISRANDFRATVRTGRRFTSVHAVVYVTATTDESPTRFGFVVSKAVGNSVIRHLVARRLRAIARELLSAHSSGLDVIVRALPGSDRADWTLLFGEVAAGISMFVRSKHAQRGITA